MKRNEPHKHPYRRGLCKGPIVFACCVALCLVFSLRTAQAEDYSVSLPRIEAAHFDELIAGDGESIHSSYGYKNSQWMAWLRVLASNEIVLATQDNEFDTLEMAEEKLVFPIARPAYLPDGFQLGNVRIQGYEQIDQYDNVKTHYARESGRFSVGVHQDYVGSDAILELKTVAHIEAVEHDGQTYLCASHLQNHFVEVTLYWLKGDFAFHLSVNGATDVKASTDEKEQYFKTNPYLDEALRIAASLSFMEE